MRVLLAAQTHADCLPSLNDRVLRCAWTPAVVAPPTFAHSYSIGGGKTMAKLFFSLAGEGRGHATRVGAMVEQLRRQHRVTLFASGCAFDMLAARYATAAQVEVRRIPGLRFAYRRGRLDYWKSLWQSAPYLRRMRRNVAALAHTIERQQPDLIISDFEPLLPRAARRCGAPFISFDHQHFLSMYDLSCLPAALRRKAWWMGRFVDAFYSGQQHSIVSSFFFPPLKLGVQNVTQVGVLLRPGVFQARPVVGRHVLVYLRRSASDGVLQALRRCGREVRVYGLGARPRDGNLRFHDVDETSFVENLASCAALVSNAGNQLVGEALYLRKPVLALPETGNFEQAVNAHFLRQSGGDWLPEAELTAGRLRQFLDQAPMLRGQIDPANVCGNDAALAAIRAHLPAPSDAAPQPVSLVA